MWTNVKDLFDKASGAIFKMASIEKILHIYGYLQVHIAAAAISFSTLNVTMHIMFQME